MMKKALVAAVALAAAGVASAQSTVTLYGVADGYVGSVKGEQYGATTATGALTTTSIRQTRINSGGLSGSRFGLRVSEDLGGGMRAYANFESGFSIDSGASAQGGALFSRQAHVGLGGAFGSVQVGRNYSAYYDVHSASNFGTLQAESAFDASGSNSPFSATLARDLNNAYDDYRSAPTTANGNTLATAANTMNGMATGSTSVNNGASTPRIGAWVGYTNRINNSIRYNTPQFGGGFTGAFTYGTGEDKTTVGSATRDVSASLMYANGPVSIALAHSDTVLSAATAAFPHKTSVVNTYIGGSYDLTSVRLSAAFNKAKYKGVQLGASTTAIDLDSQNEYLIGVAVPFGATTLITQYARSKGDDLGTNKSLGIEGRYALSKRTTAYVGFNETKFELPAITGTLKNNLWGVGIRHNF